MYRLHAQSNHTLDFARRLFLLVLKENIYHYTINDLEIHCVFAH